MKNRGEINVKVLVDCADSLKARTSFWQEFKENPRIKGKINGKYEFEIIPISERIEKGKNPINEVFNIKNNRIVIIDWDILNHDPQYKSDQAFDFIQNYIPDIDLWVRKGGVLIVECQEGSRTLRQEVYDLFGSKLGYELIIQNTKAISNRAHPNPDLLNGHPLLKDIESDDYVIDDQNENIKLYNKRELYPTNKFNRDVWDAGEYKRWQDKIHVGWFDQKRSAREWDPIIFARGTKLAKERPIMMCRLVPNTEKKLSKLSLEEAEKNTIGAYIISTMFIGSSGWFKLIENILRFQGEPLRSACVNYFKQKQVKRKKRWLLIGTILTGIALLAAIIKYFPNQVGVLMGSGVSGIWGYLYPKIKEKFFEQQAAQ